jgi:hypothetical protein
VNVWGKKKWFLKKKTLKGIHDKKIKNTLAKWETNSIIKIIDL